MYKIYGTTRKWLSKAELMERPRLNVFSQHEKKDSTNVEEIGEKAI